jgi:hypothetical protein
MNMKQKIKIQTFMEQDRYNCFKQELISSIQTKLRLNIPQKCRKNICFIVTKTFINDHYIEYDIKHNKSNIEKE